MRRSKRETIAATVESYLKRRRYQETDNQCRIKETNNLVKSSVYRSSQASLSGVIAECGSSRENSMVFSSISNDVTAAEQAYQKFRTWILGLKNERVRQELRSLLYPICCHVYLEMLHAGNNRQAATQFMKSNQNDFQLESERDFLEELSSVFSTQDIEPRPLVNAFKTRKYRVDLSDDSHICLQKFLSQFGHVILMQVINTHITIVKNMPDFSPGEENGEEVDRLNEMGINGHVEQPCGTGIDKEMRELQESIRLMKNTSYQPLRVFTVNNALESASSGIITRNIDKLAAGFNTAEIRLWGIGDTVLTRPRFRSPEIPLSCDYPKKLENVDDEETDETGAIILRGHTDVVHDMRFIAEPEVLLSVSSDKDMRAWRLSDYSCAAVYRGHNYPIWCMDTSVFNLYIATGSHDRTARLWTLDRTFPLRIYAGHFLDINCVRFHPNARYLATGSTDKTVRLWNKDDGNLLRVYVESQEPVYSLAFSPDGNYLATGGEDKNISIIDLTTNGVLTQLKGHQESVMNLDWSPDGQFLASSSSDGVVKLWPTQDFIKTDNSNSANSTNSPQSLPSNCSSILSLRYYSKNNSLVCIGTV